MRTARYRSLDVGVVCAVRAQVMDNPRQKCLTLCLHSLPLLLRCHPL